MTCFGQEHGLDFQRLLDASTYKESYRKDMIRWGQEKRQADPGFFCRKIVEGVSQPIWVSGLYGSIKKIRSGVPWWLSRLRIGIVAVSWVPSLALDLMHVLGVTEEKKKKKKKKERKICFPSPLPLSRYMSDAFISPHCPLPGPGPAVSPLDGCSSPCTGSHLISFPLRSTHHTAPGVTFFYYYYFYFLSFSLFRAAPTTYGGS